MPATVITPNEAKLKELILYISAKCADDPGFGAVKLNKLLYMADNFAYAELGQPITGVEYMKLEKGPAPRRLLPVKREMVNAREIVEVEQPLFGLKNPLKKVVPLRKPDLSMFSAAEIALVDGIIEECRDATGSHLSEYTHDHMGWRLAPDLRDTIPYSAVFLSSDPVTPFERDRAEKLIREYGWDVD